MWVLSNLSQAILPDIISFLFFIILHMQEYGKNPDGSPSTCCNICTFCTCTIRFLKSQNCLDWLEQGKYVRLKILQYSTELKQKDIMKIIFYYLVPSKHIFSYCLQFSRIVFGGMIGVHDAILMDDQSILQYCVFSKSLMVKITPKFWKNFGWMKYVIVFPSFSHFKISLMPK